MAKQKAKRGVYAMERDVGITGRELNEAERTAERATGQGIIREKEAGVWLWLRNGADGELNEKIRRERVRTAKNGSKEPFFF